MADPSIANGLIVSTNASCRIKGQPWSGIPTLVWSEGIDEAASDWFREIVVRRGVAISTAHEYANILRPFLRFCRQRKRAWQTIDDEFLVVWREHLRCGEGLSIARVNASLKTIFAFYQWAEEAKRIRFQVGIYVEDELPAALSNVVFPISAKRVFTKGRHGRVFGNWTTPLTLKDPEKGRMRHTPTEDEIRSLHEVAAERRHGERDSLMLSYAEEAGPRRAEILKVGKSQMPTRDQLSDLIERDEPWVVMIKRKGGTTKPIYLQPDLIIRTLDFIEFERREIVSRCHASIVGYREPDGIFLSSTTGMPLHPDSVSTISRRVFGRAGVKNSSIHRLRARHAVRIIETLVDAIFEGELIGPESNSAETILTKAAEMMGHAHPQSLRPYLTYVLNRRIQTADATKVSKLEGRIRQLKLQVDTFARRLSQYKGLHSVALNLEAGRDAKAMAVLRKIADELC